MLPTHIIKKKSEKCVDMFIFYGSSFCNKYFQKS